MESQNESAINSISVDKKSSRLWILLSFFAVYVIWGSTYLGIKYTLESFPPFLMAGVRFFIAGALIYLLAEIKKAPRATKRQWKTSFIIGFLLLMIGNGGLVWAEQLVPTGIAALLVSIEPLWVVVLQFYIRKTPTPGKYIWFSFILAFAGMFILVGPSALKGMSDINLVGVIVIVLSALGWAAGSVYASLADIPSSPIRATSLQMLGGSVSLLIAATLTGEWSKFHITELTDSSVYAFLYLIFFGSIIGYSAYSYLLRTVSPAMVSTYAYINPIIAVLLGAVFYNEEVSSRILWAALLLISSVILIISMSGKKTK